MHRTQTQPWLAGSALELCDEPWESGCLDVVHRMVLDRLVGKLWLCQCGEGVEEESKLVG